MKSIKAFNLVLSIDPREHYFIYYKGNCVEVPISCDMLFSTLEEALDFVNKNLAVMQGHRLSEFVYYNICLFYKSRKYAPLAEAHIDNAVKIDIRIREVAMIDYEDVDYVC